MFQKPTKNKALRLVHYLYQVLRKWICLHHYLNESYFYCLIPHFSEFVEQLLSTLYMWCTHTHAALESQRCLRNEEICLYGQSWQMRFYEEFATFNLKITTSQIMLCTELMFQNSVQCSGL